MKTVFTPISIGELYDKLSILAIKIDNIEDEIKKANVIKEYDALQLIAYDFPIDDELYESLKDINKQIWDIEDGVRDKERIKEFDKEFIELARSVYITNDKRASIKKEINTKYGSNIVEEKSYQKY